MTQKRPGSAARQEAREPLPDAQFGAERSPIPLYHRIYVILRERIVNGTYRVGEMLPSEAELMARFKVSRITARRAMDELSNEGLVERMRGRGTAVSKDAALHVGGNPIVGDIDGLMANLSIVGRGTTVEILEFDYVRPPLSVVAELGLEAGELAQRAIRVRSLDKRPFSLSTTFVLERIGRTYTREDLAVVSLIDLITRSGSSIGHVTQSITATLADDISAQRLAVQPGSPLLKLRRVLFDTQKRPLEHIEILYRPDRFEYRMTLARGVNDKFELERS